MMEPAVNPNRTPLTVKGRTVQQAHEGGKMGWSVPLSTQKFFTDIRKPLIRSTSLAMLDECPRKFLYVSKLGIVPNSYASALTMGSIVHKILACLFMGRSTQEAQEAAKFILSKEQQKLMDSVNPAGFLSSGKTLEKTLKQLEEDYHKARAMAMVFWNMVPFDAGKYEILVSPSGDKMVEQILETKFEGLSRSARTPCDLVLLKTGTNEVWIWDYKTTSFEPRVQAIPTRLSPQIALYRASLQVHLDKWYSDSGGRKLVVVGAIHAFIKKPGIKYCPDTTDKGGFHTYIDRLVKWYKELEKKDPKSPPMLLDPIRFSGPTISREFFGRLKQFCKASHAGPNIDHFYRAGGSVCLKFNKPCAFMRLCNSDPVMWPDLIKQQYTLGFREDQEDTDDSG